MLDKIIQLLTSKNGDSPSGSGEGGNRITIAACVLLLEMAGANDDFASSEMDRVREILESDLEVPAGEVESVLAIAMKEREESMDLWTFTNVINENFDKAEKIKLVEKIWGIAYSDGRLDQYEDQLVHKLANLLNVSHSELIAAKLRVKHG